MKRTKLANPTHDYMRELIDAADAKGYRVMAIDAQGGVVLQPRHLDHNSTIELSGLFPMALIDLLLPCPERPKR